jgi:septal ring factor EnvC (AmiA/AmiB activator)
MLVLTHIFLYNWQHIQHELLRVEGSVQKDPCSQQDWHAILAALQLTLLGDITTILNKAETDDDAAKTQADTAHKGLQDIVSYVALGFTDNKEHDQHTTIGVCIEPRDDAPPSTTFFILPEKLDTEIFVPDNHPLSRHHLRQALRTIPEAQTFRNAQEYQYALLEALGNLNQRFFHLVRQGIWFQPATNIRAFVRKWLLDARPLEVETLQRLAEPYNQLSSAAREVEEKLNALNAIVERQTSIQQLRTQYAQYTVLIALLHLATTEQHLAHAESQIRQLTRNISEARAEYEKLQTASSEARARLQTLEEQRRATSFSQRHGDIQREIKQANSDAAMVQSRWLAILHDFNHESTVLRPLLSHRSLKIGDKDIVILTSEEREKVKALLDGIAALVAERPPGKPFLGQLDAAINALDTALERTQQEQFHIQHQVNEKHRLGAEFHQRKENLQQGTPYYPPHVERLRELLQHVIGETPPMLCEVLEIPDERWQDAVEALLGNKRFTILVPTNFFEIARKVLKQAGHAEGIYEIGVLNVSDFLRKSRPAQPGSLAQQVQPKFPSLQPLIETMLGTIITCETYEQLYRHRQAITPDVVVYSDATIQHISPEHYRPWYIGQRAVQAHIQHCEQKLHQISYDLRGLSQQAGIIKAHVLRLRHVRELCNLRQRMNAPLDERPLRERAAGLIARQKSLDTSEVDEMNREIEHLQTRLAEHDQTRQQLIKNIAAWEATLQWQESHSKELRRLVKEREEQANETRARYPQAVSDAMEMLSDYLPDPNQYKGDDHAEVLRQLERTARGFETRIAQETQQFIGIATTYNTRYHFVARTDTPDDERYAQERQRLIETELPQYQKHIETARKAAMEGLRDYILDPMRERFLTIKQQLERFNEALARLELYGERYRFSYQQDDELFSIYQLISQSYALNATTVLESPLYQEHKTLFDQFYSFLIRAPQSEEQAQERARLLDYRSYFNYSVEKMRAEGHAPRPGTTNEQMPGPENTIAFYLVIAAAFAQLYRLNERHGQPTLRLVIFHEAFNGMNPGSIAAIRGIFERLGLQLITPPDPILSSQQVQEDTHTHHPG